MSINDTNPSQPKDIQSLRRAIARVCAPPMVKDSRRSFYRLMSNMWIP